MARLLPLLFLLGCAGVSLPQGQLDDIARDVCAVGHPHATYQRAELVGGSPGGCGSSSHDRYLDVRVHYKAPMRVNPDAMTVRLYVHGTDPCRVTTDVLDDSGPVPLLLDNGIAARAVGQQVCDALKR